MKSCPVEVGFRPANVRAPLLSARRLPVLLLLCAALLGGSHGAHAQKGGARKLPSPDKIVGDYVKAAGGKKRQTAVRDATYEWSVQGGAEGARGTARTFKKFPASTRTDITLERVERNSAANARSAWQRRDGDGLRTLTGTDANVAKLLAALDASRLIDYRKQDVLARTIEFSNGDAHLEPAYVVEFSRRNGARVSYWFGANSKLPVQVTDGARAVSIRYKDYRATQNGLLEPHRVEIETGGDGGTFALTLESVRYNTGLDDAIFEPPSDRSLNISELLRAVARNQEELDRRVSEYTFTRTETEREIDDKGVVKKEKRAVHEVYPVAGGGSVQKLISEDGVPLSAERAAKEEKRVGEALEKLARENAKRLEREARERAERARKRGEAGNRDEDENVGIGLFLRACEFVSPRRESFNDRDAIVFDFRPRPNFKPANRGESFVAKVGGGLVASVRPGSAVVLEQTRLADGVWLPRFEQINASAKIFLFAGFRLDVVREYSNYKRFSTSVGDAQVEPTPSPQPSPTPPGEH
jgi:hypothetical protein